MYVGGFVGLFFVVCGLCVEGDCVDCCVGVDYCVDCLVVWFCG